MNRTLLLRLSYHHISFPSHITGRAFAKAEGQKKQKSFDKLDIGLLTRCQPTTIYEAGAQLIIFYFDIERMRVEYPTLLLVFKPLISVEDSDPCPNLDDCIWIRIQFRIRNSDTERVKWTLRRALPSLMKDQQEIKSDFRSK